MEEKSWGILLLRLITCNTCSYSRRKYMARESRSSSLFNEIVETRPEGEILVGKRNGEIVP